MAAVARALGAAADRGLTDPPPYPAEKAALMGWAILLALFVASLALLWTLKVRGGLLTASAAAMFLGASGYALQGRPNLPGAPAAGEEGRDVLPLTDARHAFFGNFAVTEPWMRMSEALARDGKSEDAIGILQNAVKRYPGDPQLWIALGNALVDHARGLTPLRSWPISGPPPTRLAIPPRPSSTASPSRDPGTVRVLFKSGSVSSQRLPRMRLGVRWWSRGSPLSARPRPTTVRRARTGGRAPRRLPDAGSCRLTR